MVPGLSPALNRPVDVAHRFGGGAFWNYQKAQDTASRSDGKRPGPHTRADQLRYRSETAPQLASVITLPGSNPR